MDGWKDHQFERVTYKTSLYDTDRWDHFIPRQDDVFVVTPAKNGTTWMQTLVTFLIYGSTDLDFVPADRSPWLEMAIEPIEDVCHRLEGNDNRRVIKSHTPMDGVPYYQEATYVGVFRDPRDAFFSLRNHTDNMQMETDLDGTSIETHWQDWLNADFEPGGSDKALEFAVHHLKCMQAMKDRDNVFMFHYADLQKDLKQEVEKLAEILGVEASQKLVAEIAEAGTFANMKKNSAKYVPGGATGFWKQPDQFLKQGKTGQFRELVSDQMDLQFHKRLRELADDKIANWLLYGSSGPPTEI